MDIRVPLKFHTVLTFDGLPCHIEDVVGQGSNAIVYRGWYSDRLNPELKHHVLIKELFPYHPQQKIRREEDNTITVDPDAADHWNMHRASFEAGNAVHLRLLADHPEIMALGGNLNSYCLNGTLYTVLGYSGGRSLQTELNRSSGELRKTVQRMLLLLDALEAFHKSGYLHLDISPDNIMLCGDTHREQLFLIDYNSARTVSGEGSEYLSCKSGYSAPEVESGNQAAIGYPSDLYSVAAVFFRCIMGRKLTLAEMLRSKAPDGKGSPLLSDVPQTVSAMVGTILRKGLDTLPRRRYQSIGPMRQAFQELLDRIDCIGVTHWALWENGRRSIETLIRNNPSLQFLKDANQMYPFRLEQEHSLSVNRYLDTVLSPEGHSGLILAQGGMGKTTLLLHIALARGSRYSPSSSAVFYVSLSGWNGAQTDYIRTQILRTLRFRREENTFDSAMQSLHQLLQQPLKTKTGVAPTLLLLLDGLNEVREDVGPLIQEINALSAMDGVRILAASRSEFAALDLDTVTLAPLNTEDVEDALGAQGLMIPSDPEILQLLRTPLILSTYIRASEGGSQPEIHSESELMDVYLAALQAKEQQSVTEADALYWQAEAAVILLLPIIAAEIQRQESGLSNEQLLKTVSKCWSLLRSGAYRRVFRHWIGHSGDILANCQNPEQWYGIMIHRLLWQRMGLLVRDSDGNYRIFHQIMEEHLAQKADGLLPLWLGKRRLVLALSAAVACCALAVGIWQYRERSDTRLEKAIEYSASGYYSSGSLYEQVSKLSQFALDGNREDFFLYYNNIIASLNTQLTQSPTLGSYSRYISAMGTGQMQVYWSGKDFDPLLAQELLLYSTQQADYYCDVLPILAAWIESEDLQSRCPDLAQRVHAVVEADADVASELYQLVCAIHLEHRDDLWTDNIRALTAELRRQEAHRLSEKTSRSPSLEDLRAALRAERAQLENRIRLLKGHLRHNIHIAVQELEETNQLVEAFGIDSTLPELEELYRSLEILLRYS